MRAMQSSSHRPDLRILTPLRGIAALWVVVYHFGDQYLPALRPEQLGHLVGKGYLAVDLFFMLSGFVLTHVYHADFARFDPRRYRDFLAARVARLYPLHVAVLLAFVATAVAGRVLEFVHTGRFEQLPMEGAHSLTALVANLLMLQGLAAGELSWNYPAWSISVEFLAYLMFPLAIGPIGRADRWRGLGIGLALAAGVLAFAWLARGDFNQWDGPLALARCLPEFLLGSLLYTALRRRDLARHVGTDRVAVGLLAAGAALLYLGAPDLVTVGLFAVLVLSLAANRGRVQAILDQPPLVRLGELSYALYLVHGFVEHLTTRLLETGPGIVDRAQLGVASSLALFASMTVASLGIAAYVHPRVEMRGRRALRALLMGGERERRGVAA
jgi:peptidoglycan/LPS O-acetylase OafA/YrhL